MLFLLHFILLYADAFTAHTTPWMQRRRPYFSRYSVSAVFHGVPEHFPLRMYGLGENSSRFETLYSLASSTTRRLSRAALASRQKAFLKPHDSREELVSRGNHAFPKKCFPSATCPCQEQRARSVSCELALLWAGRGGGCTR